MNRIDSINFQTWNQLSDDAWTRLLSTRKFFRNAANGKQLDYQDIHRLRCDIEWFADFLPRVRKFMWKNAEIGTPATTLFAEFSAKLINRISIFAYLESTLAEFHFDVNSDAFREEARSYMRSVAAANFYSRICGSLEQSIPNVRVSADTRLSSLVHANEHDSHRLFDRLMLGAALAATDEVPVYLHFSLDAHHPAILLHNEDEQLTAIVRDTVHAPHRQPAELHSIPDLAARMAPPSLPFWLSEQFVRGSTIFLPVQLSRCGT